MEKLEFDRGDSLGFHPLMVDLGINTKNNIPFPKNQLSHSGSDEDLFPKKIDPIITNSKLKKELDVKEVLKYF